MNLGELRRKYPEFAPLDDDQVVDAVQMAFYPDLPRDQIASALGVRAKEPVREPSGLMRRALGDTGVSLLQGAIDLPEAAVGIADIVTGGHAGRMAEAIGFRPAEAKQILNEWFSPEQREAFARVHNAEGVVDTAIEALRNPSVILQSVVRSTPSIGAAGVVGRGVLAAAPRMSGLAAGAIGEGVVSGGLTAEQVRQESADGLLTGRQAAIAAASGAATSGLGLLGGRIAKQFGLVDVDELVTGAAVAADPVRKSVLRRVLEGAATEGLLEELPQSVQEQVAQNLALGKPLDQDVDQAAVLGALSGGVMGGAANLLARQPPVVAPPVAPVPEVGPLSRAANTAIASGAAQDAAQAQAEATAADQTREAAEGQKRAQAEAQRLDSILDRMHTAMEREYKEAQMRNRNAVLPTTSGRLAANLPDEASAQTGEASAQTVETAPFADRVLTVRENLADPRVREQMRELFGEKMVSDAAYYASVADRADIELPQRTRENLLAVAESMVSRAVLRRQEQAAPGRVDGPQDRERLEAPVEPQRIGLDTRPTGVMRADAAGAVRPETRADAISTADAVRAAREVRPTDILNPANEPFKNRQAAQRAAARLGGAVVAVDGGWVVRKETGDVGMAVGTGAGSGAGGTGRGADAARGVVADGRPADEPVGAGAVDVEAAAGAAVPVLDQDGRAAEAVTGVEGALIDDEWSEFTPQSGTKAVPRADMPQIKAEHRGALTQFMLGRGIAHEQAEVPASSLKPTQREFSREKVKKAEAFVGEDRAILVSSDGYVLDGHHQWMAKLRAGLPIRVIRFDAPIDDLLDKAKEFPSAEAAEGATPGDAEVAAPGAATVEGAEQPTVPGVQDAPAEPAESAGPSKPDAQTRAQPAPAAAVTPAAGSESPPASAPPARKVSRQVAQRRANRERQRADGTPFPNAEARGRAPEHEGADTTATNADDTGTAAAQPPEPAAAAAPAAPAASPTPGATDDVGENLRFNRRNLSRGGLGWSDLRALDESLRVREAVKARIWPRPDYQTLIDAGAPPLAARAVKQVYDGIAAKPPARDDATLQRYAEAIAKVRAALDAWLADETAMKALRDPSPALADVQVLNRLWPQVLASRILDPASDAYAQIRVLGGRRMLRALQFDRSDLNDWRDDLEAGWPKSQEAWQRQGLSIHPRADAFRVVEGRTYRGAEGRTVWSVRTAGQAFIGAFESRAEAQTAIDALSGEWIVLDKHGRVTGTAETEEAAREVAREATRRKGGSGGADTGFALGEARRVGPDRRAGRDVSAQELMDTFGFRGVNFGRRGYIDDAQRQAYLNAAFDGLHDLAELLNVPPKALSLRGELGIAFGAQGRGGRAAAHFVPGLNEINLTRDAGAGALAHEWGHALDHYFGTMAGLAREDEPFLSAHAGTRKLSGRAADALRPEIARAFEALHAAMNKIALSPAQVKLQRGRAQEDARRRLQRWIAHVRRGVDEARAAQFDALAQRLLAGDLGDGLRLAGRLELPDVVAQMRELAPARSITADDWKALAGTAEHVRFLVLRQDAGEAHEPQSAPSRYASESAVADRAKGGKAYWNTEPEKFARAFETWVSDKLRAQQRENTFLSDGGRRADSTSEKRQPYPSGDEREAIGRAFDALVAELRTREEGDDIVLGQPEMEYQPGRDLTQTPEFKAWFGDSKVVDAQGRPLVVYHGTGSAPTEFSLQGAVGAGGAGVDAGFFFTTNPDNAGTYAIQAGILGEAPSIMPVYLRIENPYVYDLLAEMRKYLSKEGEHIGVPEDFDVATASYEDLANFYMPEGSDVLGDVISNAIDAAIAGGHDGVIIKNIRDNWRLDNTQAQFVPYADDLADHYVVFSPEQIKSAIGNRGTFDPNSPSIVEQPETTYTPSRGDEADAHRRSGGGLPGRADAPVGRRTDAATRRTAAFGITRDIERAGITALVGQRVASPADLAHLAQVYRNPQYETFRVFFVKDGRIVHASGVTSRLPGTTPAFPDGMTPDEGARWITEQMQAAEADGYYILHNHPSGDPQPSQPDIRVTRQIALDAPGMIAHVVINSGKYATIDPVDVDRPVRMHSLRLKTDPLLKPTVPSSLLSRFVANASDLAQIAKAAQTDDRYVVMVTQTNTGVRAIFEIPPKDLRHPARARALMRRYARISGAPDVFLYGAKGDFNLPLMRELARDGFVKDVVFSDGGASLMGSHDAPQRTEGMSFGKATNDGVSVREADVLRSAATARGLSYLFHDMTTTQRGFNRWWHRTVGTQFHKARVNADFKRVFDRAQDYLHDTGAFANDAAAYAPDILPQLKSWRDLFGGAKLSKKDAEALAKPIFEGTLMFARDEGGGLYETDDVPRAGVVFDGTELRSRYGLDDRQIGMYQQFRAAVDRSLDLMMAADVTRELSSNLPPALKQMVSDGDTGRFKGLVTAFLDDKVNAATGAEERAQWESVRERVSAKYKHIDDLKARGYAPLMRFGQYAVTVKRKTAEGDQIEVFQLFESQREANAAARNLRESYGDEPVDVIQDVLPQEAYKLFSDMAPETVELFADLVGVERTEAFEAWLRLAKSDRSALKRLIGRKGTAGYSEDVSRVLAAFITSNARAASSSLHLGDMAAAIADMRARRVPGDVIDEAEKLREYVQNPQEEAARIRGLLFVQYLGGSIASAMVNMTQSFTMTYPYLAQWGGAVKAGARMLEAMYAALASVDPESELGKALAKAEREGVVSPQEIHQLQGEAMRRVGNSPWVRKGLFIWGSLFSLAEQYNRRAAFIAAWNTAKAEGIADPFAFALEAVEETQGIYNKANKPNWARGAPGSTVFTFKQFVISYMEFLRRLPPKERALALAVLMVASGLQGLPGADDLDDVVDTLAQQLGYDFNSKAAKARFLTSILGRGGADFVLHGFSAIPGFPLDVSSRLAVGNLIPGTGLLLKSRTDKTRDLAEIIGPAAGLASDAFKAIESRDPVQVLPVALRNLDKALEMYLTGQYRDTRDRRVVDVDTTDAIIKGVGFQPAHIARDSREMGQKLQQVQLAKTIEAEIASEWASGIFDGDAEKVRRARERLRRWNEDNPDSRIAITSAQIARRVREMRLTREQRFLKGVPPEMRGGVQ